VFLTQKVQNCTFRLDCGLFMPSVCDRNHDLRRASVCFMVVAAPVTFTEGRRESSAARRVRTGRGDGPQADRATGPAGRGPGRRLCRCDVTARAALAARRDRLPRSGYRQSSSPGLGPGRQGRTNVGRMLLFDQTLSNSAIIPMFQRGMTCCRSARPDDAPILERTDQPNSTRLFCRSPVRVPQGCAPRRRAAIRSSVLYDEAYVDRRIARGGNPRGGAGW